MEVPKSRQNVLILFEEAMNPRDSQVNIDAPKRHFLTKDRVEWATVYENMRRDVTCTPVEGDQNN
jgi:hypothetical protein